MPIESTQFSFSHYHRLGEALAGREEGFPGCSDESEQPGQGWQGPLLAQADWKSQEFTYEFFTFKRPIETSLVYPKFSGKCLYRRFENFPCSFRIIVIEWCRSRFLIFSFFEFSSIVSFAVYLSNCLSFEREP